jgi:hypothetical protein
MDRAFAAHFLQNMALWEEGGWPRSNGKSVRCFKNTT